MCSYVSKFQTNLTLSMLANLTCFLQSVDFYFQSKQIVGPDLGPNCLQNV